MRWLLLVLLLCGLLLAVQLEEPRKRFVPFVRGAGDKVQEGSIINVPTRCPPNMLKVGNRCRTVY